MTVSSFSASCWFKRQRSMTAAVTRVHLILSQQEVQTASPAGLWDSQSHVCSKRQSDQRTSSMIAGVFSAVWDGKMGSTAGVRRRSEMISKWLWRRAGRTERWWRPWKSREPGRKRGYSFALHFRKKGFSEFFVESQTENQSDTSQEELVKWRHVFGGSLFPRRSR